jgi:CRISP-associated protein Cas1
MQMVINTLGAALRKQGDRFQVRAGDRELAVSAHKVESILIATGVSLTSDVLQLASDHNIDVVFLDRFGDPYGRFWQNRMGSTATIRRRQIEASDGPEGLELVRGWIEAKLRHQLEFLEELAGRRPGAETDFRPARDGVRDCLERLRGLSGTVDERRGTVMGLEGAAGRVYFTCLGRLVPEAYRFEGRSRQPAKDGFNAMLNYTYGVLYSLVEKACIFAGLDPYVGFLHTDNYGKKSLVYDLIEPFRILGDRTALLLFTGRRVKGDYFELIPGGMALSPAGRAVLLESFNERLERAVRYPVQSRPGRTRNVKRRDVIRFEAHALANRLLSKSDLPRVVETRQLWDEAKDVAAADALDLDEAEGDEEGEEDATPHADNDGGMEQPEDGDPESDRC